MRTFEMTMEEEEMKQITDIEWTMMDKKKFFPLSMMSTFSIRCFLYPFTVIKTRIQIQKKKTVYSGTFDAFRKTFRTEGVSGLYKGFWVNTIQIASGMFYVTTYESVRHVLAVDMGVKSGAVKSLVGGGMASVVGQTIIVPFDIISQHMMILGQLQTTGSRGGGSVSSHQVSHLVNPLNIDCRSKTKFDIFLSISTEIYRQDGLRGFYRGYCASLCAYVPNGALWWSFYQFFSDELGCLAPIWVPELVVRCFAAPLSGVTSSLMTNPLDIVRARFQVHRSNSYFGTFVVLWQEERLGIFTKGLSARLVQSITFSFCGILGYETIKRLCVHEEYKHQIKW